MPFLQIFYYRNQFHLKTLLLMPKLVLKSFICTLSFDLHWIIASQYWHLTFVSFSWRFKWTFKQDLDLTVFEQILHSARGCALSLCMVLTCKFNCGFLLNTLLQNIQSNVEVEPIFWMQTYFKWWPRLALVPFTSFPHLSHEVILVTCVSLWSLSLE